MPYISPPFIFFFVGITNKGHMPCFGGTCWDCVKKEDKTVLYNSKSLHKVTPLTKTRIEKQALLKKTCVKAQQKRAQAKSIKF